MFSKISEKITKDLIESKIVDYDEREVYEYGLDQLLTTILNIITTLIIGLVLGMLWQAMLFVFAFMLIRTYAGGYHARTSISCYLLTTITTAVALLIIKYVKIGFCGLVILLIISGVSIYIMSPVDSKNKPLDKIEYIVYRKRALVRWGIELAVAIICISTEYKEVSICIIIAHLLTAFSQLIAIVSRKQKV